jgi:hypothetical protein
VRALINRLDDLFDQGLTLGPQALCAAWSARFEPVGRLVRVQTVSTTIAGRLLEADIQHGLTLATDSGAVDRIPTRDILALTCDDVELSPV